MRAGMAARLALLASIAAFGAYAQIPQTVQVGFEFSAGEKAFAAGQYRLSFEGTTASKYVVLQGKGTQTRMPVITTLSRRAGSPSKVSLVFDDVDGKKHLSEVWVPNADGLLVRSTKEEHKHEIVQ